MSLIKVGATVAGTVIAGKLGANDSTVENEVNYPPWLESFLQNTGNNLTNSPVPQVNLDNLTAPMNPWLMESLGMAANYASGAGQDQVDAMNMMGMNQAGMADALGALGGLQTMYGTGALDGAGSFLLDQMSKYAGSGPGGGGPGGGGYGGPMNFGSDLKFDYDQGVFDQSYGNLIGSAQNAFDSYSNQTKTNNLFQNLPGLKIGSQLIGGGNTKVGQSASLLDALTNQQIVDYGAQMQQWASGTADANAMNAGANTLQAQTSNVNAKIAAATSRANAATAAAASKYNAMVGAASNMFGYGAGMLGDAGTSFANANTGYGAAGDTFMNANTTAIGNMDTSLAAGNYVQNYDQDALDRYNNGYIFNTQQPFNMNLDMYNAFNGTATGSTATGSPSFLQSFGQLGTVLSDMGVDYGS